LEATGVCASKGEARRSLKENSILLNKERINENHTVSITDLLNDKYILVQKGKKNYFLIRMVA